MDHVEDELARADLVIALLTGNNPNVFFELGRTQVPAILLVDSADSLPFDVRHHRSLTYGGPGELETLAERLRVSIIETLGSAHPRAAEREYVNRLALAYNTVSFAAFERSDVFTGGVSLLDVYVPLSIDELKLVRQPAPKDKSRGRQDTEMVVTVSERVSLDAILQGNVVLSGTPGAGKSALLRWLAVTSVERGGRIPILIELGRLPDEISSGRVSPSWPAVLPEMLARQQAFAGIPQTFFADALASRDCLLLFDGLDEVASAQARLRISESLVELSRVYPNHRVILTTRPGPLAETETVLRTRFRVCQVKPFTSENVQAYFERWYSRDANLTAGQSKTEAQALFSRIQSNPRLADLSGTPLLATILFLIWRNEGYLPELKVQLYDRCCRMLMKWQSVREIGREHQAAIDEERPTRILAAVAYAVHSRGQSRAGRSDLLMIVQEASAMGGVEAGALLDSLAVRSGVLQRFGPDQYGFPHQTLQEYLAALYIARLPEAKCVDAVLEHLHQEWWHEVHVLAIAHLISAGDDPEKTVKLVSRILGLCSRPLSILRFNPKLNPRIQPGRYLAGVQLERRIAGMLRREFELVAAAWAESVPHANMSRVQARLQSEASDLIFELLDDRARAADSEGRLSPLALATLNVLRSALPQPVTSLLSRAFDSNDFDARRFAIGFLGRLSVSNAEALAAIVRAGESASGRARDAALTALSYADYRDPRVTRILTDSLSDPDVNIRRSSVDSLAAHCNAATLPFLMRALEDSDWEVRMSAAVGLARLGQVTEPVISILTRAHGSQTLPAQRASAKVLVELGRTNDQVLAALLRQLDGYLDAEDAAARLGEIGRATDEVLAGLVSALQHKNPRARVEAARSVAKLGRVRDDIVTGLVQSLGSKDDGLVAAAAEALGELHQSQDRVVGQLERVLIAQSHGDEIVMRRDMTKLSARKSAARSLGMLASENPGALRALLRAIDHKSPAPNKDLDFYLQVLERTSFSRQDDGSRYIKTAAAFGLAHLSDPSDETIAVLVSALDDADIFVKRAAAVALTRLGRATEPVIHALRRAMDHYDHDVWRSAAVGLIRLGAVSEELIAKLLSKTNDTIGFDHGAAVSCLGELRLARSDIVAALCRAVRKENWGLLSSLGMLDWKNNPENLRPVLIALNRAYYDANPYYRGSVLETIRKLSVMGTF